MAPVQTVYIANFLINKAEIHSQSFTQNTLSALFSSREQTGHKTIGRMNKRIGRTEDKRRRSTRHRPAYSRRGGATDQPLTFHRRGSLVMLLPVAETRAIAIPRASPL
jgi:hypothetical protein